MAQPSDIVAAGNISAGKGNSQLLATARKRLNMAISAYAESRENEIDDLRFYALVETLRSRQAPRSLASFSLDAARIDVEEVSEGLLRAALRRTIDGVRIMADLVTERREPTRRAGFQCRWCPVNESCDEGQRFLTRATGDDD